MNTAHKPSPAPTAAAPTYSRTLLTLALLITAGPAFALVTKNEHCAVLPGTSDCHTASLDSMPNKHGLPYYRYTAYCATAGERASLKFYTVRPLALVGHGTVGRVPGGKVWYTKYVPARGAAHKALLTCPGLGGGSLRVIGVPPASSHGGGPGSDPDHHHGRP